MLMWQLLQVWQVLWYRSGRRRDVAFFLGDGLCAQEGVGAGDEDGVADGDFAVGDADYWTI